MYRIDNKWQSIETLVDAFALEHELNATETVFLDDVEEGLTELISYDSLGG